MFGKARHLHYYSYAHRMLPAMLFGGMFERLAGADGRQLLAGLWEQAGREVKRGGKPIPEELNDRTTKIAGKRVILITLPPPKKTNEAYAAAMVEGNPPQYFVLEKSGGAAGAVLGGWSADGSHLNFGGCSPTIEAFLERLETVLSADP